MAILVNALGDHLLPSVESDGGVSLSNVEPLLGTEVALVSVHLVDTGLLQELVGDVIIAYIDAHVMQVPLVLGECGALGVVSVVYGTSMVV